MAQLTSWEGQLTNWYERNLGLSGGYVRKIDRTKPTSISNSEYVKSDELSLKIVARSGRKINPIRSDRELHYNHNYASPNSAAKMATIFRREYAKKLKQQRGR